MLRTALRRPLLAALALGVLLAPAAGVAGAQDARPRIVGGTPTAIAAVSHQVAIVASDGVSGTLCGGTIRDAQHVVTAAHCVYDSPVGPPREALPPGRLTVRAGSDSYRSGGQAVGVTAVAIEPSYPSGGPDAAVLTLAQPLTFGPAVQPATFATTTPSMGTEAVVSGWGATSSGGSTSDELRAVVVDVEQRSSCSRVYGSSMPRWNLCAGSIRDGEDACQGDSGGPLSIPDGASPSGWKVVGIVSSGYECGRAAFPGLYTDVAGSRAFLDPAGALGPAKTAPAAAGASARDVLAPIARVRSARCGRSVRGARRCRVTLRVTDADGSTGTVRVAGRAVPRCTSAQRRADRCPAARRLEVRRAIGSRMTFRATRTLSAGLWQLRFTARDGAGTQAVSTRRTVRVRR